MIVQSPESDMREPFQTYVRQRADALARHLAPVVGNVNVQLVPRAIQPGERRFRSWWGRRPVVYGAVVAQPADGLKSVLYRPAFGKDPALGLVATSLDAARAYAGPRLAAGNRIRVKDPWESDNQGQATVSSRADLDAAVRPLLGNGVGAVVMPFIADFHCRASIGRIDLGRVGRFTYIGREKVTQRDGADVFGGTSLVLFRDSPAHRAEAEERLGIPSALTALGIAALDTFATIAHKSARVSVDVIQGTLDDGSLVRDVIDLTPRVGGASPAEVLALAEIYRDRDARCAASCALTYGSVAERPAGARFVDTPTFAIDAWVDEVWRS